MLIFGSEAHGKIYELPKLPASVDLFSLDMVSHCRPTNCAAILAEH
jgi:hypothetical protein